MLGGLGEVSLRGERGRGREGRGNVPVVMERDLARTLRGKTVVRRSVSLSLSLSRGQNVENSRIRLTFTRNNPSNRTPTTRKKENINTNKSNQSFLSGEIFNSCSCSYSCDDELTDCHADGSE